MYTSIFECVAGSHALYKVTRMCPPVSPTYKVIMDNQSGRVKPDEAGEYSLSLGATHVSHVITEMDGQESQSLR